jgi:hypothetical protein
MECLNQCAAAILQRLRRFRAKWNSLKFQLDLQALMINRLEKPAALISINGKAGPDDCVLSSSILSLPLLVTSACFVGATNHQAVQIPVN